MTKNAPYIGEAVVKRGLAKVGKSNGVGMCQKEIRTLFGVPSTGDHDKDGDADAHDAWKAARAHGQVVRDTNPKNAPRGSYLYFSGGRHGHVALGLGGGDCVSTDVPRGKWGKIGIAKVAKQFGLKYEGWIVVTGDGYRVLPQATPVKTSTKRYEVTASVLNGRSGPGLQYPVKTKRAKGFQFDSTKSSGDWVRATAYWYHKAYLKEVSTTKPVTWRVGTLNIPLDDAKIKDGKARALIAAKQINAANLDVVAVQELDRHPNGRGHTYANQLHAALGTKNWQMIAPTTNWDENYFFVKKGLKVTQSADLILPSSVRGGHMTRISVTKEKQTLNFGNTHLVSGGSNGAARTQQMDRIAAHVGSDWIVLGDLNQAGLSAALSKTHKTARTNATASTGAAWNTYVKWGAKVGTKNAVNFFDHVLAPVKATIGGYSLIGIEPTTGRLTQPRASDHLLVIASITI